MQVDLSVVNTPSHSVSTCLAKPRGMNVRGLMNNPTLDDRTGGSPGLIPLNVLM